MCFDLQVDYDSLRGEGKAGKARELVAQAERIGRLAELEAAVRRERPVLETTYSQERVEELQTSIMAGSRPAVRAAFVEFTQQIEAYLTEFNLLHEQLEEWKEVHNLLQDLQNNFAPCRSYIFVLGRLTAGGEVGQPQKERTLYEVEVEWRPCKRALRRLNDLVSANQASAESSDSSPASGVDWWSVLKESETRTDRALFEQDLDALAECLSDFGDRVDQFLFLADKSLRDVVGQINRLPRPGGYVAR